MYEHAQLRYSNLWLALILQQTDSLDATSM